MGVAQCHVVKYLFRYSVLVVSLPKKLSRLDYMKVYPRLSVATILNDESDPLLKSANVQVARSAGSQILLIVSNFSPAGQST